MHLYFLSVSPQALDPIRTMIINNFINNFMECAEITWLRADFSSPKSPKALLGSVLCYAIQGLFGTLLLAFRSWYIKQKLNDLFRQEITWFFPPTSSIFVYLCGMVTQFHYHSNSALGQEWVTVTAFPEGSTCLPHAYHWKIKFVIQHSTQAEYSWTSESRRVSP